MAHATTNYLSQVLSRRPPAEGADIELAPLGAAVPPIDPVVVAAERALARTAERAGAGAAPGLAGRAAAAEAPRRGLLARWLGIGAAPAPAAPLPVAPRGLSLLLADDDARRRAEEFPPAPAAPLPVARAPLPSGVPAAPLPAARAPLPPGVPAAPLPAARAPLPPGVPNHHADARRAAQVAAAVAAGISPERQRVLDSLVAGMQAVHDYLYLMNCVDPDIAQPINPLASSRPLRDPNDGSLVPELMLFPVMFATTPPEASFSLRSREEVADLATQVGTISRILYNAKVVVRAYRDPYTGLFNLIRLGKMATTLLLLRQFVCPQHQEEIDERLRDLQTLIYSRRGLKRMLSDNPQLNWVHQAIFAGAVTLPNRRSLVLLDPAILAAPRA